MKATANPAPTAWPDALRGAEYLCSVQRSSPEADPQEAAREFAEALSEGEVPQVQVVRFGDGFRWTYNVTVDKPRPDALYETLVSEGLGEDILEYLFSEPDQEYARTLHTKLRNALAVAGGAPTW